MEDNNEYDDFYKKYGLWGESLTQLKSRLVYQRNSKMICLYCGMDADTREHCPPKSFLKEPYPTNLVVLPACGKCNNSYSNYENKFMQLMDALETGNAGDLIKNDIDNIMGKKVLPDYAIKTLIKVAMGHAAYKLSDGFGDMIGVDIYMGFALKEHVSKETWTDLQKPQRIDVIPELGSRGSDELLIITSLSKQDAGMNTISMVDWVDVQSGVYKYIAYIERNMLSVKMVLRDILFVKVSFQTE